LKSAPEPKGRNWRRLALGICCLLSLGATDREANPQIDRVDRVSVSPRPRVSPSAAEYLWYEAENMRGITETSRHEPLLNPSYLELPAAKAPGWSISGPGVSAEWTQGGESEWNSVAAAADEKRGMIWQDIEIPRAGEYKIWVRYADWASKTEAFAIRITQAERVLLHHEFGAKDGLPAKIIYERKRKNADSSGIPSTENRTNHAMRPTYARLNSVEKALASPASASKGK